MNWGCASMTSSPVRALPQPFARTGRHQSQTGELPGCGRHSRLRPMRYEKRVARNRFIALVIFLFLMLVGIIAVFIRKSSCQR